MKQSFHPIPQECSSDDVTFINRAIIAFNASQLPFTQQDPFIPINLVIKDSKGTVVGGILSTLYCWQCLYVDILWIEAAYRGQRYGSALLQTAECKAQELGCTLCHLDTFDFQAKDFYLRQGYQIFGELHDCPPGHVRYYLKKDLSY